MKNIEEALDYKNCEKLQQYIIQIIENIWTSGEPKKQVNRIFINEKLAVKVITDCRATSTYEFRTRLGFKQYVILTKKTIRTNKNSELIWRRKYGNTICFVIWLSYIFMTISLQ